MKSRKVCHTCKPTNNLNNVLTKKNPKKYDVWRMKLNIHKDFPKGSVPNLKNVKLSKPKKSDMTTNLDLGKKHANKYLWFYAAEKLDSKNVINLKHASNAYGKFKNQGVYQLDKNGKVTIEFMCPQNYKEYGFTYISHIHFLLSTKNAPYKWENKLYTKSVVCNVKIDQLKKEIKNSKTLIINALDFKYYIKSRIPNSFPLPQKLVNTEVNEKEVKKYIKTMLVHAPETLNALKNKKIKFLDIPIITYCYSITCDASKKLAKKLILMGFNNVREYEGGIDEWTKKS